MISQENKMELLNLIMPEMGTDESIALYNFVHRALRIARHQNPFCDSEEILYQPAIETLLEVVTRQLKDGFDLPPTYFHQRIADEYANKDYWSLDEAASLTVGMDPFYFILNEDYFNNSCRNRRTRVKAWIVKAIRERKLTVQIDDTNYKVYPKAFCAWALDTLNVDESTKVLFTTIRNKTYTPRTCGAFPEQLEFDLGPEFSRAVSENAVETNAHEIQLGGRSDRAFSQKAEGNN